MSAVVAWQPGAVLVLKPAIAPNAEAAQSVAAEPYAAAALIAVAAPIVVAQPEELVLPAAWLDAPAFAAAEAAWPAALYAQEPLI